MDYEYSGIPLGLIAEELLEEESREEETLTEAEKEKIMFQNKDAGMETEEEQIKNIVAEWDELNHSAQKTGF